jgi:hypothetical protein
MISRRRILSRSRGECDYDYNPYEEEDGIWFSKEKLFKVSSQTLVDEYSINYLFS